ncbi:uncharacterized protein LOC106166178 [Lingula anatina]|uniref:Glyoxylate reductase/hydroxypyruvate reductase n=1 Tax=Lingula anatina TaxID=7574 RepID=A0A1S3IPW4_LINAN|nr:uncharacterized protein LOC106166178 [Lingula anatina]|eukprot:XP_013400103.1 uncharacterized protein LOC106166178 [Lingula anatina]
MAALTTGKDNTKVPTKQRPAVYIRRSRADDPEYGFPDEFIELCEEHFDVLYEKNITGNPELGKRVVGAYNRGPSMPISIDELWKFPNLKIVVCSGIGWDHIDVRGLNAHGIKVANNPGVSSNAVADFGITLMLASARRLLEGVPVAMGPKQCQKFNVNWLGNDVSFASLGIVGMGDIGSKVAKRAKAFDMKIYYHNRNRKPEEEESSVGAIYCPTLADLLPRCDYVMITCPLTSETEGMFGENEFKLMKPSATIVNVARGEIIDQEALYNALKNKTIKAAALDVTYPEPLPRDHPLLTLPNIIIAPHMASATAETRKRMLPPLVETVLAVVEGRPLTNEVIL